MGRVRFSWQRSGGRQVEQVSEGDTAVLSCGARGGTIHRVHFASFGTPRVGQGNTAWALPRLEASATCHASRSVQIVAEACIGRSECHLVATRTFFELMAEEEAACEGGGEEPAGRASEPLRLGVEVECDGAAAVRAEASIPMGGARATVLLPVRGLVTPRVYEGGSTLVYDSARAGGAAVTQTSTTDGILGVARVSDPVMGDAVAVALSSGDYALEIR